MSTRDVTSLALGALGAFVAPAGFAALGFALGSAAGAALVGQPGVQGPRLNDLNVQTSTYGAPIPIVYGTVRLAGNVIWARPLRERKKKQSGGKGGGPSYTTFSYFGTFAVGLCEGEIAGIRRLWFDSVLVYDVGETASAESLIASGRIGDRITVYPGDEEQQPDPLMEATEGMDNVPGYRGLAYLVVNDLPLEQYGNRIPNVTAEVVMAGDPIIAHLETTVLNGDRIGTYMDAFDEGVVMGMENGLNVSSGGFYRIRMHSPELSSLYVEPVQNKGDSTGSTTLRVHGGNDEYQISSDGNFGHCKLLRRGEYVCNLAPRADAGPAWWFNEGGFAPEFGGLIWIRNGRLYMGLRKTGSSGGTNWNRIVCWPSLPPPVNPDASVTGIPEGRALPMFTAPDVDTADTARFCMYIEPDASRVYAITSARVLKTYDRDLNLIDTQTLSFLSVTPKGFAINGDLLFVLIGVTITQTNSFRIYRISSGELLASFSLSNATTYPNRVVPVGGMVYVQRNDTVRSYRYQGLDAGVASLPAIVGDLCTRAGLDSSDVDVSQLTATVRGYTVTQPMTARAAIEPLQRAYFFDPPERDGKIVFVPRGGAPVVQIAEDELAAHGDGEQRPDPFSLERVQDAELPRRIVVEHMDAARDYQVGVQHASRLATEARSEQTVRLPIVLDADEAAGVSQVLLYDAWLSRVSVPVSLIAADHVGLNPADVITALVRGRSYRLRLTRVSYAVPGLVQCDAVLDDGEIYQSLASGDSPALATVVGAGLPGPTVSELLDINLLRDTDDPAGMYAAGTGVLAGWQGASVLISFDSGVTYQTVSVIPEGAVMGIADTVLGAGPNTIVDRGNEVQVTLISGEIDSVSESQLLNGANAALLGHEVIQFQTATHVSGRTYMLSNLVRGRRGTEWARGGHAVGDPFVLLGTDLTRFQLATDRIDSQLLVRVVSVGNDALDVDPVALTYQGNAHRPYAPAHLKAAPIGGGDHAVSWVRRARIGGEWRDFVDVPLAEETEAYRVRVMDGETEISSADVTSPSATVAATTGNKIRVAQLSAVVGPGYWSEITL